MDSSLGVKRALLSVWDKTGIVSFARALSTLGVKIIATGGTQKTLQEAGVPVRFVSSVTGFPEILHGRVKTLHPKILGGILVKRDEPSQTEEIQRLGIEPIDLVVVNFYPFEKAVARPEASLSETLENIDIGGPTMVRAAAKNFPSVGVIVDPSDYERVAEELRTNEGRLSLETRKGLAAKAFARTATYDRLISSYLAEAEAQWATEVLLPLEKWQDLRYGENPHQAAAFYRLGESRGLARLRQLHGKELSYNNFLDVDAALGVVLQFAEPAVVVVKHNNPCGVGLGSTPVDAYEKALATDPVSAFGGIVASNRPVDEVLAEKLRAIFLEVVIAPGFSNAALEILSRKKNLRLLEIPSPGAGRRRTDWDVKSVWGGLLLQEFDEATADDPSRYRVVTEREPTGGEREALRFAWRVSRWVKSNAIVFSQADRTLGIGAGQMSRVDSVHLAVKKAGDAGLSLQGSVVGSDAFFPFRDGVDAAASAGATAVIEPGGSVRDEEVVRAANEHRMAMIFTGFRHFRH